MQKMLFIFRYTMLVLLAASVVSINFRDKPFERQPVCLAAGSGLKGLNGKVSELKKFPVWELLKALDLLQIDSKWLLKKEAAFDGYTVKTIQFPNPASNGDLIPPGFLLLVQELGPSNRFELIYNARGDLIAVFPHHQKVKEIRIKWRYFDLSPYYLDVPNMKDPEAEEKWNRFKIELSRNQALIEDYLIQSGTGTLILTGGDEVVPRIEQANKELYIYAKTEPQIKGIYYRRITFRLFKMESDTEGKWVVPERYAVDEPDPFKLKRDGTEILFPVFPTVYPPTRWQASDQFYYQALLFGVNFKNRGVTFELEKGESVLVVGPGSGFETFLVWLKTGRSVDAAGINPLEAANTRATAKIAGFPVRVKVHDNLISKEGVPVFLKRYTAIVWNQPAHTRFSHPKMRHSDNWDYHFTQEDITRFLNGLKVMLHPSGRSFVWNVDSESLMSRINLSGLIYSKVHYNIADNIFLLFRIPFIYALTEDPKYTALFSSSL